MVWEDGGREAPSYPILFPINRVASRFDYELVVTSAGAGFVSSRPMR